jgi:hypothetical protein
VTVSMWLSGSGKARELRPTEEWVADRQHGSIKALERIARLLGHKDIRRWGSWACGL